jgi:hypothetical protein
MHLYVIFFYNSHEQLTLLSIPLPAAAAAPLPAAAPLSAPALLPLLPPLITDMGMGGIFLDFSPNMLICAEFCMKYMFCGFG